MIPLKWKDSQFKSGIGWEKSEIFLVLQTGSKAILYLSFDSAYYRNAFIDWDIPYSAFFADCLWGEKIAGFGLKSETNRNRVEIWKGVKTEQHFNLKLYCDDRIDIDSILKTFKIAKFSPLLKNTRFFKSI